MPFVAMQRSTGRRIDITRVANPAKDIDRTDIVCPHCEARMTVVSGAVVVSHFRHVVTCTSPMNQHGETIEHLIGKRYVADYLRGYHGTTATIDFEVPIAEVSRIADVMVVFQNGNRVAHEIQLASITAEELEQRTADYWIAEVDVVWWLGKSAYTDNNREWCLGRFGEVRRLEYTYQSESIRK